ncbi:MAG: hypothetical protein ACLP3B_20475 [Syntrophobacteraceae bacterium]
MFGKFINLFSLNLEALRDFVGLIGPFLSQKTTDHMVQNAANLQPFLQAMLKVSPIPDIKLDTHIESLIPDIFTFETIESSENDKHEIILKLRVSHDRVKDVTQSLKCFTKNITQQHLLYHSSLISLVSSAEWFMSELLHQHFQTFPDSISNKEKTFSLADLNTMSSIEDAVTYIIDSKVEDVLRGSFEDWLLFLRSNLKLSMSYLDHYKDFITEVFQRRNILIHNGGIVNSIYLAKVPEHLREGLAKGSHIPVTDDYLNDAIRKFEICFILIAAELWKRTKPGDAKRFDILNGIAFNHLCAERWDIAERLSYFIMNDKQLPEINQLYGTLNYWQSIKWQGRFQEISRDVTDADFSAKNDLLQLAIFALLDDEDKFFPLCDKLLESKALLINDLREWPIYQNIRKTETYLTKYGQTAQPESTSVSDLPEGGSDSPSPN